jgi:putative membrane protein
MTVLLAHGPAGDAGLALLAITMLVAGYVAGSSMSRSGPRRRRREAWFAVGVIALIAALATPLETLAYERFSAHMIQHLLLTVVAAPALALASVPRTIAPLVRGSTRSRLRRSALAARWRRSARRHVATWPAAAALAYIAVLAGWHLPAMYEWALTNEAVHVVEHVTLLTTAVALWAVVLAARRTAPLTGFLALFGTSVAGGVLGALITFAPAPLYRTYGSTSPAPGGATDALADQQLAGVLMWVPGSAAYLAGAIALVAAVVVPTASRPQSEAANTKVVKAVGFR